MFAAGGNRKEMIDTERKTHRDTAYDELCGKGRRGGVMECTLRASETHERFLQPAVVVKYALSFHFKAKLQRKSRSYELN